MKLLAFCLAFGSLLGASQGGCQATEPEPAAVAETVAVAAVAADPEAHLDRTLQLLGRLENEGENYFTDLRVVLRDEDDDEAFVYVRPWLPVSVPPGPPGATGKRPETLSEYLGKKVAITATLERGTLRKVGEVYLLKVESAAVLD